MATVLGVLQPIEYRAAVGQRQITLLLNGNKKSLEEISVHPIHAMTEFHLPGSGW